MAPKNVGLKEVLADWPEPAIRVVNEQAARVLVELDTEFPVVGIVLDKAADRALEAMLDLERRGYFEAGDAFAARLEEDSVFGEIRLAIGLAHAELARVADDVIKKRGAIR